MTSKTDLPAEVIAEIQKGRKIEAIKLLRESRGMDLKESKDAVDAYLRENPALQQQQSSSSGLALVAVVLLLGIVVYLILK